MTPNSIRVPRGTEAALSKLVDLVLSENQSQNLIAKSTEAVIWERHIRDSTQLVGLSGAHERTWLDVGTGAGFPGLVLAVLLQSEHVLTEPRRRRAEFLTRASEELGIDEKVTVIQSLVEKVRLAPFGTITARAVTTVDALLLATRHLADAGTTWLLHKGKSASKEVEQASAAWSARFELLPSVTSAEASIVRVTEFAGRRRR